LVIAPEAGDRDDAAVARAATAAAARAGIPVVAHLAGRARRLDDRPSPDAATVRAIQKSAAAAHASQSAALPALIRRLDLLDGRETLRRLLLPQPVPAQRDRYPSATA
jgi:hypothetical protein